MTNQCRHLMCIVYSRNVIRVRGREIASADVRIACYKSRVEALHDFANHLKAADDSVLQEFRCEKSRASGGRVILDVADALQDFAAIEALVFS